MGTIVHDMFTDVDGTLLQNHISNVGGRWTISGAPEIQGNKVVKGVGGFGDGIHRIALPGPEYNVQAILQTPTDSGSSWSFFVRFIGSTYYQVSYSSGLSLDKVVVGVLTNLDTDAFVAGTSSHIILFEIRDAMKRVLVDGVERLLSTDNVITDAGQIAFRLQGDMTLDDFQVVSASEVAYPVELSQSLKTLPTRISSY